MSVSLSGEFDKCQLVNLPPNKTYVIIFLNFTCKYSTWLERCV